MPDIRDDSTVDAVAEAFTTNGRNKTQGMIKVGYDAAYADSGDGQKSVYGNIRVIAAIKAIDDKASYTLQDYQQDLKDDRKLARDLKQPSAAISGSVALGRSMGYDKDNDVGKDKADSAPRTAQEQAATASAIEAYHRSMSVKPSTDKELG